MRCWVNGDLRQDGQTRDMIFDIPTLIETCSRGITLHPGDVIATGTRRIVTFGYSDDEAFAVGLTCGGTIHLFLEPLDW